MRNLMRAALLALLAAVSSARAAGTDSSQPAEVAPIWQQFSGERAFHHVQELVSLGPRPAGSAAIEKSRRYLETQLAKAGWKISRQTFTDETPRGPITFVNLVAVWGEHAHPDFLLCSHYDTKLFATFDFVGANDGGSSTGLLLEIARVLAADPALPARVELVFFDGEEAFEAFTQTDGLYGSRHFAATLRDKKEIRGGMLFDMVGDAGLTITLPPDSPTLLARDLFAAADALRLRKHFTYFDRNITDDHTPLNAVGIPTIDLIDFDYPPWHTAQDTLDKLSPESLRIVGQVTLYQLAHRK